MNTYLVESYFGGYNNYIRYVEFSESIEEAINLTYSRIVRAYPTMEVAEIKARRLYSPCQYCFTEQVEGIGCPNISCPGKALYLDEHRAFAVSY